jgi:hypothetical protein
MGRAGTWVTGIFALMVALTGCADSRPPHHYPPYQQIYTSIGPAVSADIGEDPDLYKLAADSQIDIIDTKFTGALAVVDVDYHDPSGGWSVFKGVTGNQTFFVFASTGRRWVPIVSNACGEVYHCHDDDTLHATVFSMYCKLNLAGGTETDWTLVDGKIISTSHHEVTIGEADTEPDPPRRHRHHAQPASATAADAASPTP